MDRWDLHAPLYKGLVHSADPETAMIATKRDPGTDGEISNDRYVELIQKHAKTNTELVQNVARGLAAAIFAQTGVINGRKSRLVTVEGCPQLVGGKPMTGSQVMQSIFTNIVPDEVNAYFDHPPFAAEKSDCTVVEVREILKFLPNGGSVNPVTHAYHRDRTQQIFDEEASNDQAIYAVHTPKEVAATLDRSDGVNRFMIDVINAAEPDEEIVRKEERAERRISKLHAVSRRLERWTGGWINPELYLARKMRK